MTPYFEFLTGQAGTGKTYSLKQRMREYVGPRPSSKWGTLCATTGIAAVNLSGGDKEGKAGQVVTLNSALKYFDTKGLEDAYANGRLIQRLKELARSGRFLAIDEVSMLEAAALDILASAIIAVNQQKEVEQLGGLGLILTGDVCQLPPIPDKTRPGSGKFVFESRFWHLFASNTTRLTKVWRQDEPLYLEMLNHARKGDGAAVAGLLIQLEREQGSTIYAPVLDSSFDGTTIFARNADVDRLNTTRLNRLIGDGNRAIKFSSFRWTWQGNPATGVGGGGAVNPPGEWRLIPEELEIAENAYVMILANDCPRFSYANGDCGHVVGAMEGKGVADVELGRNGQYVAVRKVTRKIFSKGKDRPEGLSVEDVPVPVEEMSRGRWKYKYDCPVREGVKHGSKSTAVATVTIVEENADEIEDPTEADSYTTYLRSMSAMHKSSRRGANRLTLPYFDYEEGKWVVGEITYMPLRLAYASTVHKCVSEDTLVLTKANGLCSIMSTSVGDEIWDGRTFTKLLAVSPTGYKEAFTLTTTDGLRLTCSGDHLIDAQLFGYVRVDDLMLCQQINIGVDRIEPNEDASMGEMPYLLGLLIGDGAIGDQKEGNIHFCSRDSFLQGEFISLVETFDVHGNVRTDGNSAFCTSKSFRQLLLDLGLTFDTACDKHVPAWVLASPDRWPSFLRGLMDTDGTVGRSFVLYATSSAQLAEEVTLMYKLLGMSPKLGRFMGSERLYYQVRIGAAGLERFRESIGFTRPDRNQRLADLHPNRIIKQQTQWATIKSIERGQVHIPMWDIETESGHFSANGIVTHNCQGLSLDKIQIDPSNAFFGTPSMLYVALSRCRSGRGLRVVGGPGLVELRCNVWAEVLPWL